MTLVSIAGILTKSNKNGARDIEGVPAYFIQRTWCTSKVCYSGSLTHFATYSMTKSNNSIGDRSLRVDESEFLPSVCTTESIHDGITPISTPPQYSDYCCIVLAGVPFRCFSGIFTTSSYSSPDANADVYYSKVSGNVRRGPKSGHNEIRVVPSGIFRCTFAGRDVWLPLKVHFVLFAANSAIWTAAAWLIFTLLALGRARLFAVWISRRGPGASCANIQDA